MNCLTTKNFTMRKFYLMTGLWAALFSVNAQKIATFEDAELEPGTFYNGSDGEGGFFSGGFWFPNEFNTDWGSWNGFSISSMNDTLTAGYGNQFSSIAGSGANGSANYAVAYDAGELKMGFESSIEVKGLFVSNSTYAYLEMRDGSDWTKIFGGTDGSDPDYFKLMVWGINPDGNPTDTVEFYLADFRYEDPEDDFILKEWEWLDLTSLGLVTSLNFALESSDVGEYGMNTPAYFCLDDFTGALASNLSPVERRQADLNVYPNPIRDELFIDIPEDSGQLVITDLSGKVYFMQNNPVEGIIKVHEVDRYPAGLYIVNVMKGEKRWYRKIVKQ
jgi:hypothetical protein